MHVVYAHCCGLDVHKRSITACLLLYGSSDKGHQEIRRFGTMTRDLLELADWLQGHQVTHVAYEEAIAAYKKALTRNPVLLPAHVNLAVVYSELGREEEARAEAAEVLRLNPQYSLEVQKEREPIKDPAVLERMIAALRRAGLK